MSQLHVRFSLYSLYYLGFAVVYRRVLVTYIVAFCPPLVAFLVLMFLIILPILFYLRFQSFMYHNLYIPAPDS